MLAVTIPIAAATMLLTWRQRGIATEDRRAISVPLTPVKPGV